MSYHHQEDIARLVWNWAAWRENGSVMPSAGGSPMAWLDQLMYKRAPQSSMPTLGGEAQDTAAVLAKMEDHLRAVLLVYYIGAGKTVAHKLLHYNSDRGERCRISMRTFVRQITQAHVQFWDHWSQHLKQARELSAANAAATQAARPSVGEGWAKPFYVPVDNGKTNDGTED